MVLLGMRFRQDVVGIILLPPGKRGRPSLPSLLRVHVLRHKESVRHRCQIRTAKIKDTKHEQATERQERPHKPKLSTHYSSQVSPVWRTGYERTNTVSQFRIITNKTPITTHDKTRRYFHKRATIHGAYSNFRLFNLKVCPVLSRY